MKNPNNLILFGMKSSGKSTTAKELAKQNKMDLLSLDELVEETYLKFTGNKLSFREIFKKEGADFFRKLETQVLENLKDKGITNTVIDVGGGTVLLDQNRKILKYLGKCIWLDVEKKENLKRILKNGIPEFFKYPDDPKRSFDEIYNERYDVYNKFADNIVDTTITSPAEVAYIIINNFL